MNPIRNFLIGAACLLSMAASAQWQWMDKDGRKVYSDRAPPPDILEKNIMKRPGGRIISAAPAETSANGSFPALAAASAPTGSASAPKITGIDKELADKKKKAEEAELAKRKAEEERITKARVENCARAKQAKATLDSGVRVARMNDKGEREVMEDGARATEVKRIQTIIDADCK
jgi:hypothetical protein